MEWGGRCCAKARPHPATATGRVFSPPQVVYLAVLSWFDGKQEKQDQVGSPFTKAIAAGAQDDK